MKSTIFIALLAMVVIEGCVKDDGNSTTSKDEKLPLVISVTDGGYASNLKVADGVLDTRAAENGYQTTFKYSDKIGVYGVKDGTLVVNNKLLTYNDDLWVGKLKYQVGVTYYAYYPYRDDVYMNGKVNAAANDAAAFFKNMVDSWNPNTDQGGYDKYTACDLMIGSGVLGDLTNDNYPLTFTMSHTMALVVIEVPRVKYSLTSGSQYIWTGELPSLFVGDTPCIFGQGTYRYLVRPSTDKTLSCKYTINERSYSASLACKISAGKYAYYKVDGGSKRIIDAKIKYDLQIGDFYMKDGCIVSKNAVLSDVQKDACVGIVFQTDVSRIGDDIKKKISNPHGLVLAIKNTPGKEQLWGEPVVDLSGIVSPTVSPFTYSDNLSKMYNDITGYSKTEFCKQEITSGYQYNAFKNLEEHSKQYPVPTSFTTGWFIPSIGQWWDIFECLGGVGKLKEFHTSTLPSLELEQLYGDIAKDNVNAAIEKLGVRAEMIYGRSYWSSSEYKESEMEVVTGAAILYPGHSCYVDANSYMRFAGKAKDNVLCVRPILAF